MKISTVPDTLLSASPSVGRGNPVKRLIALAIIALMSANASAADRIDVCLLDTTAGQAREIAARLALSVNDSPLLSPAGIQLGPDCNMIVRLAGNDLPREAIGGVLSIYSVSISALVSYSQRSEVFLKQFLGVCGQNRIAECSTQILKWLESIAADALHEMQRRQ